MALTANESNIFKLVAGLFNGAPGKNIQTDLSNIVAAGTSLTELANILVGTLEFQSIVPAGQAAQADFLLKNFGFDPAATDEATTVAKAFVNDNFGLGLGQLAYLAVDFLNTTTDPVFADAAALLNNKALVAGVHAENVDAIAGVAAGQAAFVGVTASGPTTAEAALALLEDNGVVVPDPGQPGQTFTLTTGTDNLVGTADNDTFIAGESAGTTTFTVGDQIDGGAGNDTLNWVQTAAITAVPVASKVTSVETVNVTSGSDITLDTTSSFADTTALNTNTSGANQTITAAATQNVTATVAAQAAKLVAVNGGDNVTINATGVTTGTTTVGAATAAAGDVTVTSTGAKLADVADILIATTQIQGAIGVTGGSKVNVTTTGTVSGGSDNVGDALTLSAVNVTGNASTTEVTVTQTAAQTQVTGAAGVGRAAIVNGAVTITDANATSATAAGTIATVSLNSYGNSTVNSGALTTLNLAGTGGTLGVTAGALTTPVVDTLGLNVNGLTGGVITLDADYKTLNLAGNTAASTIANVTGTGVTALNISGDANVTLTAQTLAAAKNITVTNTAGAALGTALANDVLFTGGAGADSISIGETTKAINMGAGDDVVTLSSGTLGAGGSLNGGEGVDTLVANTDGSAFVADPAFGGFEVLRVAGAAAKGSHNASGFTALEIGVTAGATDFTGVAAGVGLTVLDGPTGGTTVTLANATGTNDSLGLTLKSDGALTAGSVTLAGVETVNITNTDTDTTAHTNALTLAATSAKDVVVTGNAGLTLANTGNVAITNFDASGVTGAATDAAALAVTFISANTTVGEGVTIKGGSGNDSLTGSATANDTIYGNDGDDTLVYTGRADVFHGGAGADVFDVNNVGTKTAFLTIADADSTDTIDFAGISTGTIANATLGAKVTLGGAATLDEYLNEAAAGDGATPNALVKWFQFESDTYVVVDNAAGATFVSGTDAVVKLTGAIDLSTATLTTEVLSMA
ncbi:MAG TPA: S-layer protein [Nitrosomonas mobilis]|nr:S-layer protein [Nitrosomonas mobilis]